MQECKNIVLICTTPRHISNYLCNESTDPALATCCQMLGKTHNRWSLAFLPKTIDITRLGSPVSSLSCLSMWCHLIPWQKWINISSCQHLPMSSLVFFKDFRKYLDKKYLNQNIAFFISSLRSENINLVKETKVVQNLIFLESSKSFSSQIFKQFWMHFSQKGLPLWFNIQWGLFGTDSVHYLIMLTSMSIWSSSMSCPSNEIYSC